MESVTRFLLLPELVLINHFRVSRGNEFVCEKQSDLEVCPKCASPSQSIYDRRVVRVKDAPVRDKLAFLSIRKRRFWCKPCRKPFTEPVSGITPRRRTTQRYRAFVVWACERFTDLKSTSLGLPCIDG